MSESGDALSLLTAALNAQDAAQEATNLRQLFDLFQQQPGNLPPLFPSLLPLLGRGSMTLKKWIVDVIDLTFCRPSLGPQGRSSLAVHMPEPILALLNEMDLRFAKVAIMAFASVYQTLFRSVMVDRSQARLWPVIEAIKRRIVQLFDVPHHLGVKLAAIKAYQRIILVQTRANIEGKVSSSSKSSADANVGQLSPDHPVLRTAPLEQEANERLTQVVTVIFTSSTADLVMASMNSLALLAKMRPSLSPIVFEAFTSWAPTALASQPYTTVRSVEKTLRLLYQHFHPSRNSLAGPYAAQIVEAVDAQKLRMDTAAREEAQRVRERRAQDEAQRAALLAAATAQASSGQKRPTLAEHGSVGGKRKRVRFAEGDEDDENSQPAAAGGNMPSRSTPPPQTAPMQPPDLLAAAIAALPALSQVYDTATAPDPMRIAPPNAASINPMATFDATTLPSHLVTELVIANLRAASDVAFQEAIEGAKARVNGATLSQGTPPAAPQESAAYRNDIDQPHGPPPGPPPSLAQIKQEPGDGDDDDAAVQDPLKVDMGEEEALEEAQRRLEESQSLQGGQATLANLDGDQFALKPPKDLAEEECKSLMSSSIGRICRSGILSIDSGDTGIEDAAGSSIPPAQLWTTLITRLATRGLTKMLSSEAAEQDDSHQVAIQSQANLIRQLMLEFVAADLNQRMDFALQWMAEEYHCEILARKISGQVSADSSSYSIWLRRLTEAIIAKMDSKDKSLHEFLSRVPSLPDGIINALKELCLDKSKMAAGFTMLRDMAITRIPARTKTCSILLGLARNEEKMIRGASIITVRNWVRVNGQGESPAGDTLEANVLEYAKEGLHRLTVKNPQSVNGTANANGTSQHSAMAEEKIGDDGGVLDEEEGAEDGAKEIVPPSALDDPDAEITLESDVVRLVELPFALCVRVADMLDSIFAAYPEMPKQVQTAVEKHIKPLVSNLGPSHSKLLSLIESHPPGAEALAVCIFVTVTEKQRSKKIVDLVKRMAAEKGNIDARFLLPILPDLEKAEIIRFLPRVVSLLASEKPEDRSTVKNVFTSIVTPPEQGFGSVSTNLPRVRQSELLSPVELMCLLHHADKDVGLKMAAEAIRICFGMTDIFRSEVIGAVLNQLVEEPNLPVLFMRTAIMAVRTYKSLSSYISTIFLSRLITKKVWQQPLLWDGFVLCAKQTAPASFGALIQLPREQLRDVVSRQPDLRTGLREHLTRKAGGNRGRLANFLELLDDGASNGDGKAGNDSALGDHSAESRGGTPVSHPSTPQMQHSGADSSSAMNQDAL